MVRGGAHQGDVFVRSELLSPEPPDHAYVVEEPGLLNLCPLIGNRFGWWRKPRKSTGADGLIAILYLLEKCIVAGRKGLFADREGKNCASLQGYRGSLIAHHGIEPVPRRDSECEIECFGGRPIFETRMNDLYLGKSRQIPPCKADEVRAHLQCDDLASASRQGKSRFARATADLENVRTNGVERQGGKERVIDPTWWLAASQIIEFGNLVEGLRALQALFSRNLHFLTVSPGASVLPHPEIHPG